MFPTGARGSQPHGGFRRHLKRPLPPKDFGFRGGWSAGRTSFGERAGDRLPAHLRLPADRGFENLDEPLGPPIGQKPRMLDLVPAELLCVFVGAQAIFTPRTAGQCAARWLRSRKMACDFNCEMRDSCRWTSSAISRNVNSSW